MTIIATPARGAEPHDRTRAWAGPAALAGAGVLFLLYPAVRPWGDTVATGRAAAFAAPQWLLAHLAGALAFVLVALGTTALREAIPRGPGAAAARAAAVVTGLGVGLTLLYYGAEAFALHEIGRRMVHAADPALAALVDQIRNGPVQLTVFGLGLLLVAIGGVLAAVAVWRSECSGGAARWSGVPLAVGLALYLPQFFAPPMARIAHGALVAAGCLLLAVVLRRRA